MNCSSNTRISNNTAQEVSTYCHHPPTYTVSTPDTLMNSLMYPFISSSAWSGLLFISEGYYTGSIFKFILQIPEEYPQLPPSVRFLNDMFHPLISRGGVFSLHHRFGTWKPHKEVLIHVLEYVRNSFGDAGLMALPDQEDCPNKDAYKTYLQHLPRKTRLV